MVNVTRRKRTRVQISGYLNACFRGAPASCLARDRSQPLLEAPTLVCKRRASLQCVLPGNIFTPSVLVICCCVTNPRSGSKQHIFIISHSPGAGVWAQLSWILWLESHKVTITVLTGLHFFLELGSSSKLPSVVVDRIQFLVAGGLSLHFSGSSGQGLLFL